MKKDGTDNVSFTTCFDGLYGISPNTAALEAYINRTGMTVEAENVDIPIASDGNETMNLEFVEDATATNGFYGAISARHPSNHTSFTILLRDLLAEKHYNIYCKFFPTPSGLPSLFTSQARYGNGYNEYMLPHEDMMERIPEDVRKQANIQRAYATDGKQAETMCIAFDLQPKILGGTDLIISSFGPAATKLKEVVYTRTICFDYVEIHAFDTTEEAEADYAQWKSTQQ